MLKLIQYDTDVIKRFPESLRAIIMLVLKNLTFNYNKTGYIGTLEQMYNFLGLQNTNIGIWDFLDIIKDLEFNKLLEVEKLTADNEVPVFRIIAKNQE